MVREGLGAHLMLEHDRSRSHEVGFWVLSTLSPPAEDSLRLGAWSLPEVGNTRRSRRSVVGSLGRHYVLFLTPTVPRGESW